jgi:hypothetical protein
MNLERPKPKPTPTPRPKQAPPAALADSGARKNNVRPVRGKRPRSGDTYAPPPGDDMFGPESAPETGGHQPPASSGMNLAQQFDQDAAAGVYQPPPHQQPQYSYSAPPPTYAAPPPTYAAPPPAYGAPPPGYYAPPPQAYYPPPPPAYYPPPQQQMAAPPPPAVDPYQGYPPDPVAPAATPAPAASVPPPPEPGTGDKKASKGGGDNDRNLLITLLPFGAGQFQNHNFILGLAFAAAEVGAIYFYYSNQDLADKTAADTNNYIAQNCPKNQLTPDQTDACQDFATKRQKYVEGKQQMATMGMIGFAVLWAVGVGQAYLSEPKAPKKKKKKRRLYGGFGEEDVRHEGEYKLVDATEEPYYPQIHWDLGVLPQASLKSPAEAGLSVGLHLDF